MVTGGVTTGSSARGVEGGFSAGGSTGGAAGAGVSTTGGGAVSTVDTTAEVVVATGGESDSEGGVGCSSPGSFRPVAAGLVVETRTVSVTVEPTTRVWVAIRAALTSLAAPSATTVSVTVASDTPVSKGSVHQDSVGRDEGGGAANGDSPPAPVKAINANMPPSAKNGTTTTAPKHPRPLRGSSR